VVACAHRRRQAAAVRAGGGACWHSTPRRCWSGTLERERPPLAALAIAPDPRAIQGLGLPGDLLLLVDPAASDLDASMAAVRAAQGKDMTVVLLVGTPLPACVKLWPRPTF
jgi:hypothetical protein